MKELVLLNVVAGCVLVGVLFILPLIMNSRRSSFLMSTDPEATGIERPLWGPLFRINGYRNENNMDTDRYSEMRNLPWCMDPLVDPVDLNGVHRCKKMEKTFPSYETDKI